MSKPSTLRQQAEQALWAYLNGPWANENKAHRNYPARALQALEPSMQAGTLLHDMTKWLKDWEQKQTPQFAAMVDMTWHGVRTWEEVLLMPDMPTCRGRRTLSHNTAVT